MSRDPHIAPETHARMRAFLVERGYDVSGLRKVPQQWEDRPAFDPEALD
jgi:lipocalin